MPQPRRLEAIIEIYQAADEHIHGLLVNRDGLLIDVDVMHACDKYSRWPSAFSFVNLVYIFYIFSKILCLATSRMATPQQIQALLDGPAMAPPSGIEPDFVNPENLTRYFVLTVVLTVMVSTLAFLMRVYTKTCLIRKVGWEDCMLYFITKILAEILTAADTLILGYFLFVGYCVPTSLLIKAGGGVHQWDIQLKALIPILYVSHLVITMLSCLIYIIDSIRTSPQ